MYLPSYATNVERNFFQKRRVIVSSLFFLSCIVFFGCKKTENFSPSGVNAPLALNASDSSVVLNEADKNNTALTFNWTTGSNYRSSSSIAYVLEIDKKGNNFAAALKNNIGKSTYNTNYTTGALNTLLLTYWGAVPGKAVALEARIHTTIGDGTIKGDTSTSIEFSVTPYQPVSATLYITGDATVGGNDANAADSLVPDASVPGLFHYQATLTPGQFKFIVKRGSLIPSYNRGADSAHLFYRTLDSDPDNTFSITSPKVYNIDVNIISLTITITAAALPIYSQLWIVGDATPNGWNIDNPNKMKLDAFNPYIFHYNEILNAGEFKMPTGTGNWGGDFYRPLINHPPITDTTAALVFGNTNPPDDKWQITTAGPYKISLNILYNSIHIVPFTPYTSLWLVGDATPTGWNIDAPTLLTHVAGDPYTFTYSGPLTVGEFKIPVTTGNFGCDYFRPVMNHPPVADTTAPFVAHGASPADADDYKWNITVAGNYKITFNQLYETISIKLQ
ncbi:MAG: SusF/SusE family outer membrane protein [Ginsengibacter sp.]